MCIPTWEDWRLFYVGSQIFWYCSGRGRGAAPSLLQVEAEVQVLHLASVDPQREVSCCCWTMVGNLAPRGSPVTLWWGWPHYYSVIVEVLTSLRLLQYHPSEEGKGTLLCQGRNVGDEGLVIGQHGWEYRLLTWPLTLHQQECWSILLQPHEGGNLGSPRKFASLSVGGNILCFAWMEWSGYRLKAFCLVKLTISSSFN